MAHPLTMASAVHTVAAMPTTKLAQFLIGRGENYATQELLDRMRAAYPEQWAATTLALHRSPRWSDAEADIVRSARDVLGLNRGAA